MNTKEKLEIAWKYLALILVAGLGFKLLDSKHNYIAPPFSSGNHDENGFLFFEDHGGDFDKLGFENRMDVKVEKEVVDGDTVMNITVNGKPVDASKFDENNNEMKWTSKDGEVHILKKIHGEKKSFRKKIIRKKMMDMEKSSE
jgi:hypothetical protein|tara:strand:- start:567 stop:995 length:429 start_codon:yes stop_codon:yes gene_type:complete